MPSKKKTCSKAPPSPSTSLTLHLPHPPSSSPFTSLTLHLPHPSPPSPSIFLTLHLPHPPPRSPFTSLTLHLAHPSPPSPSNFLTLHLPHPPPSSPSTSSPSTFLTLTLHLPQEQVQQWKLETPRKKRLYPSDSHLNQSTVKEHKRSSLYLSPVHELGEFTGLSAGTKNYTEL